MPKDCPIVPSSRHKIRQRSFTRAKTFKANQDKFSESLPEFGGIETFHVSGKTRPSVRTREINEFGKAKRSLITNARCLSEGVDISSIDCVLFADPRKSVVDIVQATGRALRPHPGKEYGYIIVPVLLEEELSEADTLQEEAFSSILAVLRALASDDERIVEYFRSVSQGEKLSGGGGPIEIEIPDTVDVDIGEFVKSVELKFWSRLAKLFWRPFEEAREFVRSLGLKGQGEWVLYCGDGISDKGVKPEDIPSNPHRTYKNKGWINFGDWLGTGTTKENKK